MGLLHRHHGQAGIRYQMREKLFAIGDDFWVETEGGERAFKVDGKALRVRSTFVLESPSGEELFKIQEKKLHIRDTMEIEARRGHRRDDQEGAHHPAARSVRDRAQAGGTS